MPNLFLKRKKKDVCMWGKGKGKLVLNYLNKFNDFASTYIIVEFKGKKRKHTNLLISKEKRKEKHA